MTKPAAPPAGETILSRVARLPAPPLDLPALLPLLDDSHALSDELLPLIQPRQALTNPTTNAVGVEGYVLLGALLWDHVRTWSGNARRSATPAEPFDPREFAPHALVVACAAESFARAAGVASPAQAFIAGALHDVGRAALACLLPRSYARVLRAARTRPGPLSTIEQALLGADHLQAGRTLARAWRLPAWLANCMWLHHHEPESLPDSLAARPLVHIVHLADLAARQIQLGDTGIDDAIEPIASRLPVLGLSSAQANEVLASLPERVQTREALFGLHGKTRDAAESPGAQSVRRPSEWRGQADLIAAFAELQSTCTPGASLEQVCQGCARMLQRAADMQNVEILVAALPDEQGRVAAGSGEASHTLRVPPPLDPAWMETVTTAEAGFVLLPAPHGEYLQGLMHLLSAPAPVRAGLLVEGRQAVGAVLLGGEPGAIVRAADSLRRRPILLRQAAQALGAAQRAAAVTALTDELLDATRRQHESRTETSHTRAMEMIAELAAGAAHELNNPLTVISGRAQMLLGSTGDEILLKHARIIHQQAHRASTIVSELMEFAHPGPPRPQLFDACAVLRDLAGLARERAAVLGVEVSSPLPEHPIYAYADPVHVRTAVQNLLTNALDASEGAPRPIEINCHRVPSDDTVVIAIRDRGRGMDADVLRKAFDPFFSHRPAGRSRGMGLSQALRLARINAGHLRLDSTAGQGTTARLTLPAAAERRTAAPR